MTIDINRERLAQLIVQLGKLNEEFTRAVVDVNTWYNWYFDDAAGVLRREPVEPLGVTIRKPRKIDMRDNADTGELCWLTECTGRLLLNTGCGHCLRCNREWWALLNHYAPGDEDFYRNLALSHSQLKEATARLTMSGEAIPNRVAQASPVGLAFGQSIVDLKAYHMRPDVMLEDWVTAYNAASARDDDGRMAGLEYELRTMQFPDGCQLVAVAPDADFPYERRRLVWTKTCVPEVTNEGIS